MRVLLADSIASFSNLFTDLTLITFTPDCKVISSLNFPSSLTNIGWSLIKRFASFSVTPSNTTEFPSTSELSRGLMTTNLGLLAKEFTCRYETLNFQKGYAALDGETALKFVRSRHSDINGNDFGRALRQQAFLIGVKNKLLKIGSIPKILTSVNTLSKNILTDVDVKTALEIASEQETLSDFEIKSLKIHSKFRILNSKLFLSMAKIVGIILQRKLRDTYYLILALLRN